MHDHQVAPKRSASQPGQGSKARPDNKVRLSQDVLEKADRIAAEWGLKNARAAVEAVFRCYCDDYLQGRPPGAGSTYLTREDSVQAYGEVQSVPPKRSSPPAPKCEALDALDQLLAL